MRFDCDKRKDARIERYREKQRREREWHPYFALLPVRIKHGDCRWLETIERRFNPGRGGVYHGHFVWIETPYWEYRALPVPTLEAVVSEIQPTQTPFLDAVSQEPRG